MNVSLLCRTFICYRNHEANAHRSGSRLEISVSQRDDAENTVKWNTFNESQYIHACLSLCACDCACV